MSHVTIIVPPSLRRFVDGNARLAAEAATVREAVDAFTTCSASLRGHLFEEDGALRRFVRVFVDGRPSTLRPGVEEPVRDGTEVTILLALAGG